MTAHLPEIYKMIADESILAIIIFNDNTGNAVYANQPARDLLELPLNGDFRSLHLNHLYPPDSNDKRVRRFSTEILQMQGYAQEVLVNKLNGRGFISSMAIKHVMISNEKCYLLMIQDVTLQKKLQREINEKQNAIQQTYQELLTQNKQLKELDIAKNRFIAMTTHELRTPLSAMVASAEILKLKLYDGQEQHDEFLNMIYDQGNHMLNLVNDILDFAKIQANKMDYFVEEKDVLHVIKNEVESLQTMAEKGDVAMRIEALPPTAVCYFDELRIRQVFANLINNAIKYNKPKGEVIVRVEDTDKVVKIYIQDTGKGIATEDQPKVFNEFETLGKVANHSKGTGLGLPISQRMIVAMGGSMHLTSEPGVGSTFWIEVPKTKVLTEDNYRSRPDSSGDLAA